MQLVTLLYFNAVIINTACRSMLFGLLSKTQWHLIQRLLQFIFKIHTLPLLVTTNSDPAVIILDLL